MPDSSAFAPDLSACRRSPQDIVVALAGNPNVGKSTVFNALTGLRQHTGNWPGKTVSTAQGYCRCGGTGIVLVDLPGTYSLLAHSAEEEAARDFIRSGGADAVIVVCDATCLERSLILFFQIAAVTDRVVVCVNLMDEARHRHIHVDLAQLERTLGTAVVGTSARSGDGLDRLMRCAADAAARTPSGSPGPETDEQDSRRAVLLAEQAARACVHRDKPDSDALDRRLDRLFASRRTGFPIMLLLLFFVFWLTISGANIPSQWLSARLFSLQDTLSALLLSAKAPAWLHDALILGVFRVLAWVVSVMLPPMAIFFPLFTLLEDFGYLPRVAFNLDHCFKKACACGKQALCMCMGLGCNAAGVIGCRIIDSPRERLIAILTNSMVPCNGRFPTILSIISMFFLGAACGPGATMLSALLLTGVIVLGVGMTLLCSRLLSKTVLAGMPSGFTLELPPYRRPQIGKVIVRSVFDRTLFVLGRAAAVAAPAGLVIWLCANLAPGGISLLERISGALDPFASLFGLDGVILLAFILGFPANEIVMPIAVMAYLSASSLTELGTAQLHALLVHNGWTPLTAVCTIVFSLFHWPCSTTCLTIHRETGSLGWTLAAFALPTTVGLLLCFVISTAWRLLAML